MRRERRGLGRHHAQYFQSVAQHAPVERFIAAAAAVHQAVRKPEAIAAEGAAAQGAASAGGAQRPLVPTPIGLPPFPPPPGLRPPPAYHPPGVQPRAGGVPAPVGGGQVFSSNSIQGASNKGKQAAAVNATTAGGAEAMVTTKAVPEVGGGGTSSSNTPPVAAAATTAHQQSAGKRRAADGGEETTTVQGEKPVDTMQVAALARVASALATRGAAVGAHVHALLTDSHCLDRVTTCAVRTRHEG